MNITNELSIRKASVIVGISILIMTIAAIIATQMTIGSLFVENNAVTTTQNIKSNINIFRTVTITWIVILICDVFASWGLYILLKPVNLSCALIMSWLRLVYSAILGIGILNLLKVIALVDNSLYANTLGIEQFQTEILLNVKVFYETWSFGLIIFSLHVLVLGYLLFKSGFIPRTFGVLLMLEFVGNFTTNILNLMPVDYKKYKSILEIIFMIPMLSEVAFGIWLLIFGRKLKDLEQKNYLNQLNTN